MRHLSFALVTLAIVPVSASNAATSAYRDLVVPEPKMVTPIETTPAAATNTSIQPISFAAPPSPVPAAEASVMAPVEPVAPVPASTAYDPMVDYALSCPPNVTGVVPDCGGCSHWFAGVDLGATEVTFVTSGFAIADSNTGVSVRPYVGWENYRGVGFRARGWLYGLEAEAILGGSGLPFDIDVAAAKVDLEMYKRLQIDSTSLVLGVGSRGAGFSMRFPDNSEDELAAAGLSAFADLYQPFIVTPHSEWGWIGGARLSALRGEGEYDNILGYSKTDATLSIVEANMGLQCRTHWGASDLLFQLQLEEQVWDSKPLGQLAFSTTGIRVGWEW